MNRMTLLGFCCVAAMTASSFADPPAPSPIACADQQSDSAGK